MTVPTGAIEAGELAREEDEEQGEVEPARTRVRQVERGSQSRLARLRGSARRYWAWLVQHYATVDPRSVGVCRILLGALLFADVARRYRDLDSYYTNLGWLTNHFSLYRPMSSYVFSIYHAFSTPGEVRVLFFFHCLVNLAFLVGYRTRLSQLLAIVLLTSLNSRNIIIENGGFVMLTLLAIWTWVLPMGQRFSVDAWLRSWRARRERTLADLNDRSRPRAPVSPIASLAVTAVILQWTINYFLNTVHKSGATWHNGTAVYYFVHQARLLHPFGVWMRDHLPLEVFELMTHGTLLVEGTIAFLWVSPLFTKAARMVAWVLGIGLHLGILVFATLGPFVWVMMIPYAMFIPREVWEWGARRMRVQRQRLVVLLDPRSRLSLALGRIIKRLDALELVRFAPAADKSARRSLTLIEAPLGPEKPRRGRAAVARLIGVLPLPRWCAAALVRLGGASALAGVSGRLLARRKYWARRLGLDRELRELPAPSRGRRRINAVGYWLGEAFVGLLMLVSVSQVLMENRAVPAWLKPKSRPEWMTAMIVYPRLFQGWSMFAPDPPRDDGWVVVDGRTVDGRKLDPLTGKVPNFSMDLPGGPDFSAQWEAFHMRIHEKRFEVYYPGFEEYLKNEYEISGRPEDRLVAFDVWYVMRTINPPGRGYSPPTYRKLFSFGKVEDSGVPKQAVASGSGNEPTGAAKRPAPRPKPLPRRSAEPIASAVTRHAPGPPPPGTARKGAPPAARAGASKAPSR